MKRIDKKEPSYPGSLGQHGICTLGVLNELECSVAYVFRAWEFEKRPVSWGGVKSERV